MASVICFRPGIAETVDRITGDQSTKGGIEHSEYTTYDLKSADRGVDGLSDCALCSRCSASAWMVPRAFASRTEVVSAAPVVSPMRAKPQVFRAEAERDDTIVRTG